MATLIQHLEAGVADAPDRPLFVFLDRAGAATESYTYGTFHHRTNGLARALTRDFGVAVGEPILLAYPPGLEMIAAFIACVKAGALPVPVPAPAARASSGTTHRIPLICASAGARRVLTDERVLAGGASRRGSERTEPANAPAALPDSIDWVATNRLGEPTARYEDRSQGLLFLQYTSGSTMQPRGVMVTHENVIANCLATVEPGMTCVCWLPHFHDMGLIGHYLFPMIRGGTAYHFSAADFLRRPLLWLDAISRFGATHTAAPNFAYEYCLRRDKLPDEAIAGLNLASMRFMMNAAEHVRPDTMGRFRTRFAPAGLRPEALVSSYGLAENTLCASTGGRAHVSLNRRLLERNQLKIIRGRVNRHNAVDLASCGAPIGGVTVRIVSPDGSQVATDGEAGEIWLAGPSRAAGYWNQPDLTREVFHARLPGDAADARYLRTGDIGFLHEGELYICGRLKDMITVRGANVYPADVDAMIEQALPPGTARVAAFGDGGDGESAEGLVVLIEWRSGDPPPDLRTIHRTIRARLHAPIRTLAHVARGSLAITSSGKIARRACRQQWSAGLIHVLGRLDPPCGGDDFDLLAYIQELIDLAEGDETLTLSEIGLDSLELVTLSLALERLLTAAIGPDVLANEVFDLRTIQSIPVGVLKRMATEIGEGHGSGAAVRKFYRWAATTVAGRDGMAMRRDLVLSRTTKPRVAKPAVGRGGPAGILLTGATGFLGVHLLETLLRLTPRSIVVLARGQDADHVRRRLASALARAAGAMAGDRGPLPARVDVLCGDLAEPRLGLSAGAWDALAGRVDTVFHCGAEVDYVKTYDELRRPNADGTRSIIELCCTGPAKALHYVSSTFIFGWEPAPVVREDDWNAGMHSLDFGYTQSKWVAERLVAHAIDRGVEARVYRPAFVTASRHGHYVREDLLARVFSYMIRHRISVDTANQLSIIPVDVAAQNIVALALLDDPGARVFHLTADRYYSMRAACEQITARFGYTFDYVSIAEIIRHMNRFCGPDDVLYPLVAFFRSNSHKIEQMRDKRYDNVNYRSARARSGLVLPEPDLGDTMGWIVEFLRQQQLIPSAPTVRREPLASRRPGRRVEAQSSLPGGIGRHARGTSIAGR